MQWMATDFAQERKWKMATAKKVLEKHFFDSEQLVLVSLSLGAKLFKRSFSTDGSDGNVRHRFLTLNEKPCCQALDILAFETG